MTTREADRVIRAAQPVAVQSRDFNETFTATFVRRDRHNIYSDTGGVFDRDELKLVPKNRR